MFKQEFLDKLSPKSRDAVLRTLVTRGKRKGLLLRNPPSIDKDPLAWAAWQGIQTACGRANQGTIAGIIVCPLEVKGDVTDIWDEVSDAVLDLAKSSN